MRLTLLILFAVSGLLFGQAPANHYIDVVHLHGKDAVSGTVITYNYGSRVILVQDNGTILDFEWDEVKRVNFRLDKDREEEIAATQSTSMKPDVLPEEEAPRRQLKRKFMHQFSTSMSFGATQIDNGNFGFRFRRITIGGGAAYHFLRSFNKVNVGLGVDLSLMNHQLQEKVLSATGQVEYLFGNGKRRPFVRLEAGMTYPFGAGSRDGEVTERAIAPLVHPSVGLEFGGENGPLQRLFIDLGYRFLTNTFTITDANLDVIQRKVNYQRLVLRAGVRF
ncbi:hypothetical protein [Neolewinella persica]|uniref:hypothetical protein n=1 Tax=Neolewinella persica TaxID=70998 RepID=UPI00035F3524|nr:hypothetical protein [Neolewinella persica]